MGIALFLVIILQIQTISSAFTVKDETDLREELFVNKKYNSKVRPYDRVHVDVLFNLMTINDLNIRDQSFQASGWFTLLWDDDRLSWNSSRFGGVDHLFTSESDVWRPVLIISNAVKDFEIIHDAFTPLRIDSTGRVVWEPPGIYEVSCSPDITYYPLDKQLCFITIQSWSYNINELNVSALVSPKQRHSSGVNLKEFQTNDEWDLIDNYTSWGDSTDAKGDEYAQIKIYFQLRRKSQYYWLNIILPVIVNSVLTSLVFALPAESGEKMGYSLTVLLSFAVLLTLVADKIPSTSTHTSIMVVYFSVVLIMGAMAVLLSTVVIDLYFKDNMEPIPNWVKFFYKNILGRLVCYEKCSPRKNAISDMQAKNDSNNLRREKSLLKLRTESFSASSGELNWQDISRILDRFFLRLYIVAISGITIGFLLSLGVLQP